MLNINHIKENNLQASNHKVHLYKFTSSPLSKIKLPMEDKKFHITNCNQDVHKYFQVQGYFSFYMNMHYSHSYIVIIQLNSEHGPQRGNVVNASHKFV